MNEAQKKIYEEQTAILLASGIVSEETKNKLDSIRNNVETITAQTLEGASEAEKDALYAQYKEEMIAYGKTLKETTYKVDFTKEEFDFMHTTVMRKLTYNRQDLFIVKQVAEAIFDKNDAKKAQTLQLSIELVTWLSHLIGKFEVQGFGQTAITFLSVVEKLINASRVFDVYNKRGEELSTTGANWIAMISEEEATEGEDESEVN